MKKTVLQSQISTFHIKYHLLYPPPCGALWCVWRRGNYFNGTVESKKLEREKFTPLIRSNCNLQTPFFKKKFPLQFFQDSFFPIKKVYFSTVTVHITYYSTYLLIEIS